MTKRELRALEQREQLRDLIFQGDTSEFTDEEVDACVSAVIASRVARQNRVNTTYSLNVKSRTRGRNRKERRGA